MQGRLAVSLNDDGTVTLRCDADAFFVHANKIRRLLTGSEGETEPTAPIELKSFWAKTFPKSGRGRSSSDLSSKNIEILALGYYLTRERGFEVFSRQDLETQVGGLPEEMRSKPIKASTLIHLARRKWLERVRRGAYRLSRRAIDRIEGLRTLETRAVTPPRPEPPLPRILGLSRFLREVPANRKWRRVLLVGYFLQEHCGIAEFDHRLLSSCFKRVRGVDPPGSLSALISQTLYKRRGLLERGSRRGMYRLTAQALEELRGQPRIAQADALHQARNRKGA